MFASDLPQTDFFSLSSFCFCSDKRGAGREATGRRLLILTSSDLARLGLRSARICSDQDNGSAESVWHRPSSAPIHPSHKASSIYLFFVKEYVYNHVQMKGAERENLAIISWRWQKWSRGNPSAVVWLRQNQQKARFRSISPGFVDFNFSINCPLCKEVGSSWGKKCGQFAPPSYWKFPLGANFQQSSTECAANPKYTQISIKYTHYTDINQIYHFSILIE